MIKKRIKVNLGECKECLVCQLRCSLAYTGKFNPEEARIKINWPGEIVFTDDCVESCVLCARYCPFGALEIVR
jgi:NAD-dependent dihydropyrimidine dehydrogenase PreA subunit